MKVIDLAQKLGMETEKLIKLIEQKTNVPIKRGIFSGIEIPDDRVNDVMAVYKEMQERQAEMDKITSSILVSSGFTFDGYKIVKYSGYISGDDTVQIDRGDVCNNNSEVICDALVKIRVQALRELREAAYALGCNAIIGVDFDYMTFEPQRANADGGTTYYPYMICVTANGNAVVIEKE